MSLRVNVPGPLALVQDLGRPGFAHLGVPASGALDRPALLLANRLVGNEPTDAAIEILLGGLSVTALAPHWLALTGAAGPAVAGSRPAPLAAPFLLDTGETLELGVAEYGVRYYLAVRGGVDVPPVLGSRSTDVLSGLGPSPLVAGGLLSIGIPAGDIPVIDSAALWAPSRGEVALRVTPGPRVPWFAPGAWQGLVGEPWVVHPESNRVGMRLTGGRIETTAREELPSEGVVTGALQVPPNGEPILFLADHPVTGGYPVIAVVASADLHLAAQLRPGQRVRFLARGGQTGNWPRFT